MNVFASPRTAALAVSTAVFAMQLFAFGSSANHSIAAGECPEPPTPNAITVPPVAPESPGIVPVHSENGPVSI